MQIKLPKPFFFEEGPRAVLLLHGFTGNSADVRQLGRFYRRRAIRAMRHNMKAIFAPPEEILESSPHVWYKDALDGYDFLVEKGYEEIVVVGLSLGGCFALKLSLNRDVKGIVTMCSPMYIKTEGAMFEGVLDYARNFKNTKARTKTQLSQKWCLSSN